ncbi:hypothetical protein HZB90_04615 [archaeon]|nr:hypothetical protein [archaeon]
MIRKAIQLANNTLVVSLPAKWVQQNSIAKGADLDIDVKDTSLIVRKGAAGGQEVKKIKLDISGMSASLVWNYLNSIYRAGFNEIEIFFTESKIKNLKTGEIKNTMEIIASSCNRLIGMGIMKQSKNSCLIKEVTRLTGEEYQNVFNRIFLSLVTVSQDVLEAVNKKDDETLEYIYMYSENNVNKLADYCMRILNTTGMRDFKESDTNYLMTFLLEEVGDIYADIAKHFAKKGKPSPERVIGIIQSADSLLHLSHKFFLNPKREYYVEFHEARLKLKKDIESLLSSPRPPNAEVLFLLRNAADKLMEICNARVTAVPLLWHTPA